MKLFLAGILSGVLWVCCCEHARVTFRAWRRRRNGRRAREPKALWDMCDSVGTPGHRPGAGSKGVLLALLCFAPLLSGAQEPAPNLRVSVLAGSIASLGADANGVEPLARIRAEARLTKIDGGPNLDVVADLTALPGESIDVDDPHTYRALELSVGVSQPLGGPLLFSVYAEAGFASRLHSDPAPRMRSAKWVGAGLLFQTRSRAGRLSIGVGKDQRLGSWVTACQVTGHVVLREVAGVKAFLVGSATLSLEPARTPAGDSIRVGIALGL